MQAPDIATPFDSLATLLGPQLEAVNVCLFEKMRSGVALIPQMAGYLVSLGGKRLRPLLTIASAELCGYQGTRHIHLGACVELIHTATLFHDDVVDESALRRGQPSANVKWGNKASILVGDFLFSRAFELMVADGSLPILQLLSKASSTIIEGEIIQFSASHKLNLTEREYFEVIEAKTACLFSAATTAGAMIAGAPQKAQEHLSRFGRFLGLAFQIMDDLLDYTADQGKLGKPTGSDFREGKMTLPLILAYAEGRERPFWEDVMQKPEKTEQDFLKAIRVLEEAGTFLKTKQIAKNFVDEALATLQIFPQSYLRNALEDLAHFSVHRTL